MVRSKLVLRILIGALVSLGTPGIVSAKIHYPLPITCPVGGEKFTQLTRVAWTTYGARPDGREYSNYVSPSPMPECPKNKLLIAWKYSEDEVAKLEKVIADPAYAALRKSDSTYYRAYWMVKQAGVSGERALGLIQRAKWESDADPERRARYTSILIGEAEALIAGVDRDSDKWWQLSWMLTNAHRELGAFDKAAQLHAALPLLLLDVAEPEKKIGTPATIVEKVSPIPGMPEVERKRENLTNAKEIQAAKRRKRLHDAFVDLGRIVANKNDRIEPVQLIPHGEATRQCKWKRGLLHPSELAFCDTAEMKERVSRYAGDADGGYD